MSLMNPNGKGDGGRPVPLDALNDENFETPQQVTGKWSFMKDTVLSAKGDAEEELDEEFSTFRPVKFIKRDFHYLIRVEVDNGYVDLYWRGNVLDAVKGGISLNDKMSLD